MSPNIAYRISTALAYAVFIPSFFVVWDVFLRTPIAESAKTGLSAVALVASLGALSLNWARNLEDGFDKTQANYAGEKFIHSAFLLIQAFTARFLFSQIEGWDWIGNYQWLLKATRVGFAIIMFAMVSYSLYAFCYGFNAINTRLWQRWISRWEKLNSIVPAVVKEDSLPVSQIENSSERQNSPK